MPALSPRPSDASRVRRKSPDEGSPAPEYRPYEKVSTRRGYTVKAGAATRSRLRRGAVGGHGDRSRPNFPNPNETKETNNDA